MPKQPPSKLLKIPEYRAWKRMKFNYPNDGCGTTVCGRWRTSYATFLADMGPRPSELHKIIRTNRERNFEPGNCAWKIRRGGRAPVTAIQPYHEKTKP